MKISRKLRFLPVLLLSLLMIMMTVPTMGKAAQPTVNLRTTESFAVLAGETITNTGPTTINGSVGGNVGLHPGSEFKGRADVTLSGAVHVADAVAIKAKTDLVAAYDDAASRTPVTRNLTGEDLGGLTLTPGVYSFSSSAQLTGTLTLDAGGDPEGVFIFQIVSTLITASGSNINLINGARYCRVFWKVGSSATLGTNSHFVGHIFALTSIAAETGATVQGQLLARNGAVTLDTNTITNGICATVSTPTPSPTETPTSSPTETPAPTPTGTPVAVVATAAPTPPATRTVTGGELPDTATPWYNILLLSTALTTVGTIGYRSRKRYE